MIALAIATLCFYPPLKWLPFGPTMRLKPYPLSSRAFSILPSCEAIAAMPAPVPATVDYFFSITCSSP